MEDKKYTCALLFCLFVGFFLFYIKKVQRVPLFSSSVFSLYEKNGEVVGVVVLFVYFCWFCFAWFFVFPCRVYAELIIW